MVLISELMAEMQQSMRHLQRLFVEAMEDKDYDNKNDAGDEEYLMGQQRKKTRVDSPDDQPEHNQTPAQLVVPPLPP